MATENVVLDVVLATVEADRASTGAPRVEWAPGAVPGSRRVRLRAPLTEPGVHLSLCTGLSIRGRKVGRLLPFEPEAGYPHR